MSQEKITITNFSDAMANATVSVIDTREPAA